MLATTSQFSVVALGNNPDSRYPDGKVNVGLVRRFPIQTLNRLLIKQTIYIQNIYICGKFKCCDHSLGEKCDASGCFVFP